MEAGKKIRIRADIVRILDRRPSDGSLGPGIVSGNGGEWYSDSWYVCKRGENKIRTEVVAWGRLN